jgi:hypothetical protein
MTVVRIHFKFLVVYDKGEDESTTLAVSVRCACNDDSFAESFFREPQFVRLPHVSGCLRVSNAPPTQPHCDPRRPSRLATSGCCCSFVAQRRRRKTGSRKMAGSKTIIIRSRPNREEKRCVKNEPNVRSIDWYRLLHQALEMPLV